VPLYYAPGEAYQFDWSHEIVMINGVTVTVKVAHVWLCHSRMMFARAYMRESQEMVFDAHNRAFAFFRGTCTRGIYDSETLFAIGSRTKVERRRRWRQSLSARKASTTVVSSRCAVITSSSRRPLGSDQWRRNERPCTPASGWEKGQVENQVGLVRERFFTPRLRVKSLDELNVWLLDKCVAYAEAHRHPEQTDQMVWQMFGAERPHLVSYAGPFDGFHSVPTSVPKTCTVRFDSDEDQELIPGDQFPEEQILGDLDSGRATRRGACLCRSDLHSPG
jgi:transposase